MVVELEEERDLESSNFCSLHAPRIQFSHLNTPGAIVENIQVSLDTNSQSRVHPRGYHTCPTCYETFDYRVVNL